MQALFQPDPVLLTFLAFKKFAYLLPLALLALMRVFAGRGLSRWLAFLALLVALAGLCAQFGPAYLGLYEGPLYRAAAQAMNAAQGMGMPLAATVPLALSGLAPGRRWPVLDLLHGLLFAALLGLWIYTL